MVEGFICIKNLYFIFHIYVRIEFLTYIHFIDIFSLQSEPEWYFS